MLLLFCYIKKKVGKNYVNFLCKKKKNLIKCNGNVNLRYIIIKYIFEKK